MQAYVQRYTTTETLLDIHGLQVRVTRIADFEELLQHIDPVTFAEDERLPYWAELWPASVALGQYVRQCLPLAGRHVLELGCGLGLVGLVAALQGAHVVCTDYEEAALDFARYNARRNACRQMRFQLMDWRRPRLPRRYEYILASDVIYEARNFGPLVALLRRYLARGGRAVFSEPGRVNAVPFFALLRQHGFICETLHWPLHWEGTHRMALHIVRYNQSPGRTPPRPSPALPRPAGHR
ncbi:MAG: methyltransferase [Candidatus Tectimicrobiota bacterium]